MEEHAKELEHDLRENIDLLENKVQEVWRPTNPLLSLQIYFFSERTIDRTTSIYNR